jgi:mRNA-degrading endonuclease RelE of RelBE toxin-antitoxin system
MRIDQSGVFRRRVKKLHSTEKKALDAAIKVIEGKPEIGDLKSGDLASLRVYKYKYKTQKILLAYIFCPEESVLTLIALGAHENFYQDLKRQ